MTSRHQHTYVFYEIILTTASYGTVEGCRQVNKSWLQRQECVHPCALLVVAVNYVLPFVLVDGFNSLLEYQIYCSIALVFWIAAAVRTNWLLREAILTMGGMGKAQHGEQRAVHHERTTEDCGCNLALTCPQCWSFWRRQVDGGRREVGGRVRREARAVFVCRSHSDGLSALW